MRIKKAHEENRIDYKQIKFRVSAEEFEYLTLLAREKNWSIPQFSKNMALQQRYHSPKIDYEGAILIANELRRYGSNLNQIAKWCNEQRKNNATSRSYTEIQAFMIEIEKGLGVLWEKF